MAEAHLTIVSHNAYWFQGWPSMWGQEEPRAHPQIVEALTSLYARLAPDVLCLQEVPDRETLVTLESRLGMRGIYVPGAIRADYGGAVLTHGAQAVLHDLSQSVNAAGQAFERICIYAQIEAQGLSLDLLALHLSSNRYAVGGDGESLRMAELDAAFAGCADPALVVGDFNALPGSRVYARMEALGFADTGNQQTAYITGQEPKRRRVDYVWIAVAKALEVVEHRVISGPEFAFGEIELSDHLPICVRLRHNA